MAVSPPFAISETLPADSDLISIFPSQEHPFRDTVESWLTFLSDPTTGLLKSTAFAFPVSITNTLAGTFQSWESTDPGAAAAPILELYRNSASPAVSDFLGSLSWQGKDSGAAKQEYANIGVQITDPTAASEDANMILRIVVAGTITDRLTLTAAGMTLTGTVTYAGAIAGLTGTGALTSGSIGSGFGSINIGSNAITAGAASFTTVSGTSGTFSAGVSSTTGTFSGALSATTGTFSGAVGVTGNVTASGSVQSTGNIFGNGSAGTLNFRPNGIGSSTSQMTYSSSGNLTVAGDVTASSDRRLKKSISPLNHLWANDMVREVQPMTFLRKKNDQRGIGFIAQDVQGYAPELVQTATNGMLSLAYPNMVAILWAVVQDLQAKVAELEAK